MKCKGKQAMKNRGQIKFPFLPGFSGVLRAGLRTVRHVPSRDLIRLRYSISSRFFIDPNHAIFFARPKPHPSAMP